jgi:hypothetical protein
VADASNEVLTSLLDELGWSPRALARRINHVFGTGTAPYHWRDSGASPRPPLPELAAWVLSRELDRIGSLAVTCLERVQSVRSAQVLRLLARRSRRCDRNEYVRDLLPILDAAVARQLRTAF